MVIFKERNDKMSLWFGGIVFTIFFAFNIFGVILPFLIRTIKYWKKSMPKVKEKTEGPFSPLSEELKMNGHYKRE